MTNVVWTNSEKEIFKCWLLNKKNKEIAEALRVSESYVSQTIKKVKDKISTVQSSISMMEEMGLIEPVTPLKFTPQGRRNFVDDLPSSTSPPSIKDLLEDLAGSEMVKEFEEWRSQIPMGSGVKKIPWSFRGGERSSRHGESLLNSPETSNGFKPPAAITSNASRAGIW